MALAGGWLHTDDIAVVDPDGYLTIVDRKKDLIISGGENISSVEVEKVLAAHPAVLEVAVVGRAARAVGRGAAGVGGAPAGRPRASTPTRLVAWARERLAGFKVPKDVVLRGRAAQGRHRQGPEARPALGGRRAASRLGEEHARVEDAGGVEGPLDGAERGDLGGRARQAEPRAPWPGRCRARR